MSFQEGLERREMEEGAGRGRRLWREKSGDSFCSEYSDRIREIKFVIERSKEGNRCLIWN